MAGGIDHSIYFQQTTPDIMGGINRGLKMREQLDERNRKKAIQGAYNKGFSQNEDGTVSYDAQKTIGALAGQELGQEAYQMQQQHQKDQAAQKEMDLNQKLKGMEVVSQILGSSNDEQSWEAGKARIKELGLPLGPLEGQPYSPTAKQVILSRMVPAQEQLKMQLQRDEMGIKKQNLGLKRQELAQKNQAESLTPGQKKVDQEFAKEYDKWTSGGAETARSEINKLQNVVNNLKDKKVTTGGLTGLFPDRMTSDEVLSARSDVQSTVMNSLRAILGAQFTEKEGERIIKNTWNEADSTENNKARLERLISDLAAKADAKDMKASYYEQRGSLKDFSNESRRMQARESQPRQSQPRSGSGVSEAYATPIQTFKTNEIEWAD